MKKLLKKGFFSIAILLVILAVLNYDLLVYGIEQAKGQLKIIREAQPVEEVLRDPSFPDSLKANLRLIDDIKRFAFDSLGINPSENYSTVYDQQGRELMFVVTACEPFELKPKKWKFPIIGTFSYKGFFNEERANALALELAAEGYDTNVRTAGGWSTLGWLTDPILSNMLAQDEAGFAELIIHELTHGTLFVKDSVKFNENLATFVGVKGTERYLRAQYGENSEILRQYRQKWEDRKILANHILHGAMYLDSLYKAMKDIKDIGTKKKMKAAAIKKIIMTIDTLNLADTKKYVDFYLDYKPNNTFFMSYLRYRGDYDLLEKELQEKYGNDIRRLMEDYKTKYPSL